MNEHELFTQPHDELLRIATDLGIANVSALTKGQLVHAIAVALAAQEQGRPWAQTARVVFRPAEQMQTALIRNQADRPVRLSLELVDSNEAFTIPTELQDVVLQGRDALSVPVRFSPSVKGVPITTSVPYAAGIHVWDREANCIVATVQLLATGPGYQTAPCVLSPQPEGSRDQPLPKVYLEITPEWTLTYQQNAHVKYRLSREFDEHGNVISGATEIMTEFCDWPSFIMEDDQATDEFCYFTSFQPISYPPDKPFFEKEFDIAHFGASSIHIFARDTAGQITHRYVATHVLQPIGYCNARTPGPVYRSTINALSGFLYLIEASLKAHKIQNNTALDQFPNSSYLRYELEDDILTKMQDVIIFTDFGELPFAGRYETIFDDPSKPTNWWQVDKDKPLCWIDPANPIKAHYGSSTRKWVSICYQKYPPNPPRPPVADATTLLHELYHYAVREDQIADHDLEEAKAIAISRGCNLG
jgi:hypothetical protein